MPDKKCSKCGEEKPTTEFYPHTKTGKPRGVLCSTCNSALGLFVDDPENLRSAARYLELHRGQNNG
jgi:hypothetical protein